MKAEKRELMLRALDRGTIVTIFDPIFKIGTVEQILYKVKDGDLHMTIKTKGIIGKRYKIPYYALMCESIRVTAALLPNEPDTVTVPVVPGQPTKAVMEFSKRVDVELRKMSAT